LGIVHEVCRTGGLDAAAAPIIDSILKNGPDAVSWTKTQVMELGDFLVDDDAAERAEAAGLRIIMNRCPKPEYTRLIGN